MIKYGAIALSFVGKIGICASHSILYVYTPETYPTNMRYYFKIVLQISKLQTLILLMLKNIKLQEKSEDTQWIIRSRKSKKDRKYKCQK